jgi:hypothetical protein
VQNSGAACWRAEGAEGAAGVVRLGAHLLAIDEELVVWDYWRAQLTHDLQPDQYGSVTIDLRAPDELGDYIVEFDMVLEHVSWFEDLGTQTLRSGIRVD